MYNYTNKQTNVRRELDILLSKTLSMFRYEGLPDSLPQRELERQLQTKGYAFVTKFKGKLYSFTGGLGGEPDPYGNPTQIVIANPALDFHKTLDLEKDGVLIRSDSMMNGLKHLLEKYVTMMNESEVTMMVNSFNARFPALISAGDDKTKESAEQYLQRIVNGEMGIIAENRLFEGINVQNTGGGGSVFTQLIEYQQYLKATLYNELGLEMNNNMKRERLTQDEVNMTDIIYPFVDNMITNREMGIEKINKMFDKEITVGFDSVWAKHAPSDAWDDDEFYGELDEYLELFMGQGESTLPIEEPVEEDVLPDISEDELLEVLEQLKALSEEVEHGTGESSNSDADSGSGPAITDEELRDTPESGGDIGSSPGSGGHGNESGEHHTGASDEADGESEGVDASTEQPDDGDTEADTTDSTSTEEPDDGSTDGSDVRRDVGSTQTEQTHIELTVSTGRTNHEDSGAHSEADLHEESGDHSTNEGTEPGHTVGTGSAPSDITDEDGRSGEILLEGAEVDETIVETTEDDDRPEVDEDGLQTVEVALEIEPTGEDEAPSVDVSVEVTTENEEEKEEDEDESS